MLTACIADIERAATHDGPGLRTTVFFKGCPLSCAWCHNPECIDFKPQVLYYPQKCIGCGECDKGCFSGAKVVCGKNMTVDEVYCEIKHDKDYYGNTGGVTFSGGEPFAQKEFLSAIIDRCNCENIRCAVETSMIYYDEEIFRKLQLIMCDLKIWDNGLHKEYTGVSNEKIKENIAKANELGIPIIVRTPVIPGIDQGFEKIHGFVKTLKNIKQYELLPYHSLGQDKRIALGMKPDGFMMPDKITMERLKKYVFIR